MLKLGISSTGLIFGSILDILKLKYSHNFFQIFLNRTELCLNIAEKENLNVCELIIDFPILSSEENKKNFIELCNSYSIEKQIHGPFLDINLCSHNDKISKISYDLYIESAIISEKIGAKLLTIHPGVANVVINSINNYNMIRLIKNINGILNFIEDLRVKLCIENMARQNNILLNIEDFNEFLSRLNRKNIYITYDTSHHWTNVDDPSLFWAFFHKIIKNVHLVDNNIKSGDPHLGLGKGKIDFNKIFSLLKKYKYNGPLILELNSKRELIKGIKFVLDKM